MRAALLCALLICGSACLAADAPPQSPVPADRAVATMIARPGFEVELVAAEPLVMDPVSFAWGPDGRLWVAEMADYPLGIDGKGKFGGRIRYLEDTDGDGRYDRSTVFLDGIGYPNGVMPWHNGVLVTAAPDIFYAEDADGDGKAEIRRPLYTGFVEGNQQHRVNGLRWGLDNWVYCGNGDSGGTVVSEKTGAKVARISVNGRDMRIRPDTGEIETVTGITQFGRDCDDWGNWFGSKNSQPVIHYVLDEQYLRRNPFLAPSQTWSEVPSVPGAAPIYPRSQTAARFNDFNKANRFTSACGMCIYRDELFGPEFTGNSFVCEPVHNLVHREILKPSGSTFVSHRAADEQTSEFLASTDNWCRPVMVRTGPDGALWVADMYRETIEHPQWIPQDWQKRLDLRAGQDKGRIYRVYPTGKRPRPIPRLDRLSTVELVAMLEHPSGTLRDLVQQMLVHKQDKAAIEPLKKMVTDGKRPQARLHALCTLDGLNAVDEDTLVSMLPCLPGSVMRHAVRLADKFVGRSPRVAERLGAICSYKRQGKSFQPINKDPQFRLQLCYSVGFWPSASMHFQTLVNVSADHFMDDALISSVNASNVASNVRSDGVCDRLSSKLMPTIVGLRDEAALTAAIGGNASARITAPWKADGRAFRLRGKLRGAARLVTLRALLDAVSAQHFSLSSLSASYQGGQALARLDECFSWAREAASLNSRPSGEIEEIQDPKGNAIARDSAQWKTLCAAEWMATRTAAIALLGREPDKRLEDSALLASLLNPHTPQEVQSAAIVALVRLGDASVLETLLSSWSSWGPALRGQVLDALLARPAWTGKLLDAIEKGELKPAEIDAARAQRLLGLKDKALAERASKLLAGSVQPDRQKAIAAYDSVLHTSGDAKRGAAVFEKRCSTCHKIGKVGHAVGPDLTALTDKTPKSLLVAILDPNRAVETKFINYSAVTDAGLTYQGMLAAESANSVTLLQPDGKEVALLRSDLEALASTGKSLMPEGLEKDLKPQDLADVFALLSESGPKRKTFAGNRPEVVEPEALRGEFYLMPQTAELFGDTVVWESHYGNFGHWESENDQAVWTLDAKVEGPYDVWLEYACDNAASGNSVLITAGGNRLLAPVVTTGSWDNYRTAPVGRISLPAGKVRLVLRPAGKPHGALFDLQSVRVRPVKR
jgi:putative membrane-bound dehydrogenase-like protein